MVGWLSLDVGRTVLPVDRLVEKPRLERGFVGFVLSDLRHADDVFGLWMMSRARECFENSDRLRDGSELPVGWSTPS